MGETLVNRNAAMPLYHQIFLQLRDEILSGQRSYGSLLPSEHGMFELFGVSRITAKRVFDELSRQKFVERKARVGTKVIFNSPVRPIEANFDKAMDSLLGFGRATQVDVLEIVRQAAPESVSAALKMDSGDEVLRAVRVRSLDDMPLGYVLSYVPAHFARSITCHALETMPIRQILNDAGHCPITADQTISAMLADAVLAEALQVEQQSAVLKITRIVCARGKKPILLTYAHYRADRFNIRLGMSHLN